MSIASARFLLSNFSLQTRERCVYIPIHARAAELPENGYKIYDVCLVARANRSDFTSARAALPHILGRLFSPARARVGKDAKRRRRRLPRRRPRRGFSIIPSPSRYCFSKPKLSSRLGESRLRGNCVWERDVFVVLRNGG